MMQEKYRQLQTPFQTVSTKFRNSKRETQRGLTQVLKTIVELKNANSYSKTQICRVIAADKQKLMDIKRKLSQNAKQQNLIYQLCKKRIHKHQEWEVDDKSGSEKGLKYKDNFHREIVYFLSQQGQSQKAQIVEADLQIQDLTSLETELYKNAGQIAKQILENNLRKVKKWCFQNTHMLTKIQSSLEFKLIACEYVNILNNSQKFRAVEFLRKSLPTLTLTDTQKKLIEKLTILLVTKDNQRIEIRPYLQELMTLFADAFQKIYRVNFILQFEKTLGIGISALKTVCCMKQNLINPKICPICEPKMNKLSENIPSVTKQQSSIICRINCSLMTQLNPPMVLPNGQVYSLSGLNQTEKNGKYYCPNTQTYYDKNLCKKIYLA